MKEHEYGLIETYEERLLIEALKNWKQMSKVNNVS